MIFVYVLLSIVFSIASLCFLIIAMVDEFSIIVPAFLCLFIAFYFHKISNQKYFETPDNQLNITREDKEKNNDNNKPVNITCVDLSKVTDIDVSKENNKSNKLNRLDVLIVVLVITVMVCGSIALAQLSSNNRI